MGGNKSKPAIDAAKKLSSQGRQVLPKYPGSVNDSKVLKSTETVETNFKDNVNVPQPSAQTIGDSKLNTDNNVGNVDPTILKELSKNWSIDSKYEDVSFLKFIFTGITNITLT